MMEKKYFTLTYGCQMNESDTERINGQLEELGYVPASVRMRRRRSMARSGRSRS